MAIGSDRATFTKPELHRGHSAGSSYGRLARVGGGSLAPGVVPDALTVVGGGSPLVATAPSSFAAGLVYCVYLGHATGRAPIGSVSVLTTATTAGTGNAVVGVATTTDATSPDFTAKTVVVRAVSSAITVDSAVGGRKVNAVPFNFAPGPGEHLWVFYLYEAVSGTLPTIYGLTGEVGLGSLQRSAGGQTIAQCTVGKVYSFVRPTPAVGTPQGPALYVL